MARTRKIEGWMDMFLELGDLKFVHPSDNRLLFLNLAADIEGEHIDFINAVVQKVRELGNLGELSSDNVELLKCITLLESKKKEIGPKKVTQTNRLKLHVDFVRWLLEGRGYTLASFSERLDRPDYYMSGVLKQKTVSADIIQRISKELNVPLNRLILEVESK